VRPSSVRATSASASLVAREVREQLRNHVSAGRGYDHPHYRHLLNELIAAERAVRNTEGGYWIASLDPPDAARPSLSGSVHIGLDDGQVRAAALLSDGLNRSATHLAIHGTWADLLQALLDPGPQSCIDAVREVERATLKADASHEQQ
jgi:hypothetical protein